MAGSESTFHEDAEDAEADEDGPALGVVVSWRVDGADEEAALAGTARFDRDGLLCDKRWSGSPLAGGDEEEDDYEDSRATSDQAPPNLEGEAGSPNSELELTPAEQEMTLLPPEASQAQQAAPPHRAGLEPEAQLARISAQIARLDADLNKDLDAPARAVWDELYQFFRAKMAADLTDEDQSEIEQHLFEHLPRKDGAMVWKVYKLLHLEQERDRLERQLTCA